MQNLKGSAVLRTKLICSHNKTVAQLTRDTNTLINKVLADLKNKFSVFGAIKKNIFFEKDLREKQKKLLKCFLKNKMCRDNIVSQNDVA